ncbi:sugar ABC transporter ATP-binding protein [Gemmiger formicilis]|jgi:ABC-type sugar transport system ATPase subunit|uniref:sugar ABC transporter ATP-binding protein n=1 Tax=Gemmiger formicilis TaxID=745368 RepID=UPI002F9BE183
MDNNYILTLKNITKEFPGVKALDDVTINIERGTIHGLVGENGAGKSTLIKILAGIYQPNKGEIILDGKPCRFNSPIEARRAGISVVHQEIKLAEPLSVAENMFLGNVQLKNGLVDWKGMRRRAREIVEDLGMDIDINAQVSSLTVAKKQIVEIMHAINNNSRILIMDEPSAVLTDRELEVMFRIVKQLRDEGITIIYISHRLDEIFGLCSNVSVLRDGCHIDTIPVASVDRQGLINMMVGREMGQEYPKEVGNVGGTILEVKNLSRGILQDISFEVKSGEVFGISGLVGAGRTELARAILGIDKPESGEVYVRGKKVHYRTFADAIRDGLGLIPEDRKLQGLVQIMSVKRNTTLVNMKRVLRAGVISSSLEEKLSKEYADKLHVVTPSMETEVQYLSGGNQQKVVIAKWLFQNSEILFLDEPTRGIDVGAKAEIYRLINRMAKEGKTIIMISSEMPELLGMCDRIMVMHEGHKMGELNAAEATQEKIMALCS